MARIVFMGTADLACSILQALCREPSLEIVAVVSQPDKPRGRDQQLQATPVKAAALRAGLRILQPERARDPAIVDELRLLGPELIVVAAYGQILPQALLDIPRHGCLNVHTSLLPKYRGAAPIQWAILDGQPETGVTIMKMNAGLDTGDIVSQARTDIAPEDNAQTLHDRLARMGGELLIATIPDYLAGRITPRAQSMDGASYARKITREDGRIDWNQPARMLWNRVRGLTPWPGSFTFQQVAGKPRLLKIWSAQLEETTGGEPGKVLSADVSGIVVACGTGALRMLEVQREGGRRLSAKDFLVGNPMSPDERLG
ncbi:MAG: methionyl-tRNA formyltransferase [Verrucomicrobiota bacterium]|jgi:methionyl-tRNA formyltransferase